MFLGRPCLWEAKELTWSNNSWRTQSEALVRIIHPLPMKSLLVFTKVWDLRSNAVTLAFVISLHLNSMHACRAHTQISMRWKSGLNNKNEPPDQCFYLFFMNYEPLSLWIQSMWIKKIHHFWMHFVEPWNGKDMTWTWCAEIVMLAEWGQSVLRCVGPKMPKIWEHWHHFIRFRGETCSY